jgi:RNA polymerase sigma-70 factor (ECF subfamily)
MVQEAFVRLARADLDSVEDARGWLVVVVGRLCLDHLRSDRVRWESAAEPGLLDLTGAASTSLAAAVDPADRVTLDDTVRAALLSVLEKLTPAERTAFILHDVFRLPFDTIGDIVGRTPTACRQLASRARHRLRPDLSGDSTPGGVVGAAPPASGRENVARRVLGYIGPRSNTTVVSWFINGQPAIVVTRDGAIIAVVLLSIRDGLIDHLHAVGDPIELARASE